jgi:uncharacterized protein YkwD
MRKSILTASVALIALAGCGASSSSTTRKPAFQQEVTASTRRAVDATTTSASLKAKAAHKKAAHKKAALQRAAFTKAALMAAVPTTAPYVAPPVVRAVVVAPTPPPTPAPAAAPAAVTSSGAEGELVADINSFRASHGLSALTMHADLVRKAEGWARFMANGGCGLGGNGLPNICHSTLTDGITVQWTGLAENVGMVSPSTNVSGMHNAYVNSPAHAANMLNGKMTYVGVGIAIVGNYMYSAEVFMST